MPTRRVDRLRHHPLRAQQQWPCTSFTGDTNRVGVVFETLAGGCNQSADNPAHIVIGLMAVRNRLPSGKKSRAKRRRDRLAAPLQAYRHSRNPRDGELHDRKTNDAREAPFASGTDHAWHRSRRAVTSSTFSSLPAARTANGCRRPDWCARRLAFQGFASSSKRTQPELTRLPVAAVKAPKLAVRLTDFTEVRPPSAAARLQDARRFGRSRRKSRRPGESDSSARGHQPENAHDLGCWRRQRDLPPLAPPGAAAPSRPAAPALAASLQCRSRARGDETVAALRRF